MHIIHRSRKHSSRCNSFLNCFESPSLAQPIISAAQSEDTAAGVEEAREDAMGEEIAEHDNAAAVHPACAADDEEEEVGLFEEDFDYGIAPAFVPTLDAAMNRAQQADRAQEAVESVRAAHVPTAANLAGDTPCFMQFLAHL